MSAIGLLDRLFGKTKKRDEVQATSLTMLNQGMVFSTFGNNAYASDVVRATIHIIASSAAKLKPRHIRRQGRHILPQDDRLARLLASQPNPYMNAYDFYYKLITQLLLRNNAFVMVESDERGEAVAFYPLNPDTVELLEYQNELYLRFQFRDSRKLTLPYTEVIHLRRFFNSHDIFGESNNALLPTLDMLHTVNQGIINAIKHSATIRGLLKFTAMIKPEDLKKQRDDFVRDFMSVENENGIAATDAKADFVPLESKAQLLNHAQMKVIEEKVYKYFNINERIVTSAYNEDEWNAFYEGVIEPLALQLSLAFTARLFTERERGHGNEIIFEANRLQYASVTTKINLVNTLMPMGLLTINESREIFNLGAVEDGDRRLVSLNYVDADKANQYQLGEEGDTDGQPDKERIPDDGDPGGGEPE